LKNSENAAAPVGANRSAVKLTTLLFNPKRRVPKDVCEVVRFLALTVLAAIVDLSERRLDENQIQCQLYR
jgi:hypothetical protein